jgi:CRP-like cAMP-binding protein
MRLPRSRGAAAPPYADLPFFEGWTDADLARLGRLAEVLDYAPGEVVCPPVQLVREFFVVLSGRAEVVEGSRRLDDVGPGDTVGEQGLLSGGQLRAAVVARTPLTALYLGPREFHGLLREAPSFGRALSIVLADRLARLPVSA